MLTFAGVRHIHLPPRFTIAGLACGGLELFPAGSIDTFRPGDRSLGPDERVFVLHDSRGAGPLCRREVGNLSNRSRAKTMSMRNNVRAVQRAVKAGLKVAKAPIGPAQFEVGSTRVVCSQCKNDRFEYFVVFFQPFLPAHALQCSKCSHIELFGNEPNEVKSVADAGR